MLEYIKYNSSIIDQATLIIDIFDKFDIDRKGYINIQKVIQFLDKNYYCFSIIINNNNNNNNGDDYYFEEGRDCSDYYDDDDDSDSNNNDLLKMVDNIIISEDEDKKRITLREFMSYFL